MLLDLQSIKIHESDCREKSTKKRKKKGNQGKKKAVTVPAKPKKKHNKYIYMQAMRKRLAFIAGAHQKKKKKKKKKKRIHSTRNKSKPFGPSTKPGGDLHLISPRLHEKESQQKPQVHHQISKEREIEQHLRRPMTTAKQGASSRSSSATHRTEEVSKP
jgi:hypothetical protein